MDYLLLASVALPGVVFGAGYIFAYNLPIMSTLHINLYQTVQLLVIAYIASSLPTNARVLVGSVSQLQPSLQDAARAHGAGAIVAWARGVLPVLSRPIMMAWLYTFCGVFLELPLSQLLYAPGSPPASIAIEDNLSNYHFGVGMAQAVLAVAIALRRRRRGARRLPPARPGRAGGASEGPSVAEPISIASLTKTYPGGGRARAEVGVARRRARARSWCCSARPGRARRRCCAAWPGIERIDSGTIVDRLADRWPTAASHVPPEQRDLSMVFQDYALWPHLTAAGQRRLRAAAAAAAPGRVPGPGGGRCSTGSGLASSRGGTRTSCPAASSSGSRWPGR